MPESVKAELKQFNENNNPILLFFNDITVEEIINHTTKDIYVKYDYWCKENGIKGVLGAIKFGQELCKHFNLTTKVKSVEGRSQRIYVVE
jgi:putative DNA primase/helicase